MEEGGVKMRDRQKSVDNVTKILEKFTAQVLNDYKQILLELLDKRLEKENQPQPNLPNKVADAYRMGLNDGCMVGLNEAKKLIRGTKV